MLHFCPLLPSSHHPFSPLHALIPSNFLPEHLLYFPACLCPLSISAPVITVPSDTEWVHNITAEVHCRVKKTFKDLALCGKKFTWNSKHLRSLNGFHRATEKSSHTSEVPTVTWMLRIHWLYSVRRQCQWAYLHTFSYVLTDFLWRLLGTEIRQFRHLTARKLRVWSPSLNCKFGEFCNSKLDVGLRAIEWLFFFLCGPVIQTCSGCNILNV